MLSTKRHKSKWRFISVKNLISLVLIPVFFSVLFYGCGREGDYKRVDFSKTIRVERPKSPPSDTDTLRVAVGAMISPQQTYEYYRGILDYLGRRVGRKVHLVQRKTYGEVNELLAKGLIDIAFICSGPYAFGKKRYNFVALATPQVRGKPFYQSYLIVNKKRPYQEFEDLRSRVFAFTDPDSNSGTLVPKYWLSLIGERPETFFKSTNYTYSHDNSILAVAKSLVDGATVDGHIWEYYQIHNPIHTSQTRIIKKSVYFGSPPLVASKDLSDELKQSTRKALFFMHQDPEGKPILESLMIERFVAPKEDWYTPIMEMMRAVRPDDRMFHETRKS